jgi:hypothetical protein
MFRETLFSIQNNNLLYMASETSNANYRIDRFVVNYQVSAKQLKVKEWIPCPVYTIINQANFFC